MRRIIIVMVAAAVAVIAALVWFGRSDDDGRAGATPFELGRSVYVRSGCQACHGNDGLGRANMAPGLVHSPVVAGPDMTLQQRIRTGSAAGAWRMGMPPFTGTARELEAVITYVRSAWRPAIAATTAAGTVESRPLNEHISAADSAAASALASASAPIPVAFTGSFSARNLSATAAWSFSALDQRGQAISATDLRGRWVLVYLGYTYCPDICPGELEFLARVLRRLGPLAERIEPIFVTLDPARDTPAVLAAYVAEFHPRLRAITAAPTATAALLPIVAALGGMMQVEPDPTGQGHYLITHSTGLTLVDPNGVKVTRYRTAEGIDRAVADLALRLGH